MRPRYSPLAMTDAHDPRGTIRTVFAPPLGDWPPAGVYQLWLRVSVELRPRVGRLGRREFPPGLYVYTGRASRGLPARVRRHLRLSASAAGPAVDTGRTSRPHWHIDYLLMRPEVRVARVVLASANPEDECRVNLALGWPMAVPGFGATDCRHRCGAHLRAGPGGAEGCLDSGRAEQYS